MPSGKNPFVTPGLRLVNLYILLVANNKAYTLSRLADIFGCSKQTVLRNIEQLELVRGVELDSWIKDGKRWYQVKPPERRPNIALTSEAIQHLVLCRDIVRHLLPEQLQKEIRETIGATAVLLPEQERDDAPLDSFAEVKGRGTIDYTPFQNILDEIQTAMREQRLCKIKYRDSKGQTKEFIIAPHRIMAFRESLYILCYKHDEDGTQTRDTRLNLAVHRFVKCKMIKTTFDPIDDEQESKYFGFEFGEPFQVRVAFSPAVATYVSERTWSKDQRIRHRKDGSITLTFTTTSEPEVISWILSFGPEAELLEPKELRNGIKNRMMEAVERYAKMA
ncbi:MAG: WYL domain-containing transcriptional regulator [Candidatus Hydrogenedentes bacterium]|nr:WYL domain-containing transcriptional regulator [Candidatus Hydrogenedentota bacterium]